MGRHVIGPGPERRRLMALQRRPFLGRQTATGGDPAARSADGFRAGGWTFNTRPVAREPGDLEVLALKNINPECAAGTPAAGSRKHAGRSRMRLRLMHVFPLQHVAEPLLLVVVEAVGIHSFGFSYVPNIMSHHVMSPYCSYGARTGKWMRCISGRWKKKPTQRGVRMLA